MFLIGSSLPLQIQAPSGERRLGWGKRGVFPPQPTRDTKKPCEVPSGVRGRCWRTLKATEYSCFFSHPYVDDLSSSNSVSCHLGGKSKVRGNCHLPQHTTTPGFIAYLPRLPDFFPTRFNLVTRCHQLNVATQVKFVQFTTCCFG